MKRVFEYEFNRRKIVIENGELAKQANGSVLVKYDDTVVLSTAVMSNVLSTNDFFRSQFYIRKNFILLARYPADLLKEKADQQTMQP